MAHHERVELPESDTRRLEHRAWPAYRTAFIAGAVGLVVALLLAFLQGGAAGGAERFLFAYLVSFAFALSLSLGSLIFVLLQHVFRGGWGVVVRRPAEVLAATMPTLAVLFVPIALAVIVGNGLLYSWTADLEGHGGGHGEEHAHAEPTHDAPIVTVANEQGHGHTETLAQAEGDHVGEGAGPLPEPFVAEESEHAEAADEAGEGVAEHGHAAELLAWKAPYLNRAFFILRWIVYFGVWAGLGLWYWRSSTRQDETGDETLTLQMQKWAPPAVLLFALTATFASFDLLMSLDPMWYSTIFGVYYFAGSFLATVATLILVLMGLQRLGYCQSVTREHYHDLGKLLFAFVFFWGYIAFSQYMLIWYASLPETTYWFDIRGVTTVPERIRGWTWVSLLLLVGHLLIPFAGLLSRHVKRNRKLLAFWAVWLLVFHWLDMYWLVVPRFSSETIPLPLVEIACLVGVLGIYFGGAIRRAALHPLTPQKDPRLGESLRFHNI